MHDLAKLPLDIKIDLLLAIHYYGWRRVDNGSDAPTPYFTGVDIFTVPPRPVVFYPSVFFKFYDQLTPKQRQLPSAYRYLRSDVPSFSTDSRVAVPFMESQFDGYSVVRDTVEKHVVVTLMKGTRRIDPTYAETSAQAICLAALTAKHISIADPL